MATIIEVAKKEEIKEAIEEMLKKESVPIAFHSILSHLASQGLVGEIKKEGNGWSTSRIKHDDEDAQLAFKVVEELIASHKCKLAKARSNRFGGKSVVSSFDFAIAVN